MLDTYGRVTGQKPSNNRPDGDTRPPPPSLAVPPPSAVRKPLGGAASAPFKREAPAPAPGAPLGGSVVKKPRLGGAQTLTPLGRGGVESEYRASPSNTQVYLYEEIATEGERGLLLTCDLS